MKLFFTSLFIGLTCGVFAQAFVEVSEQARINHGNRNSGVAVSDFDSDGWDDVYVSVRDGVNRLYRNEGDGTFTDVAAELGLDYNGDTRTSGWGDINNDGHPDLYLGNDLQDDQLYLNNGDGTFSDITASAQILNKERPYSILFADIDHDGFLDMYIANFQSENKLYKNNGDNTFTDITMWSGALDIQNNMGAVFFDYDNDGDEDLYLCHDGQANILYENDGSGQFADKSVVSGLNFDGFGMGVDVADINRDGYMDIYITNLFENVLFLNNGDKTFTDIAASAGVDDYGMGWGTNFVDVDKDGWVDIHVANDSYFSAYSNVIYRNKGDLTFEKVLQNNPITSTQGAFGSACLDINRDGAVDLFIANAGVNNGDHNQLFKNETVVNHFIGLQLIGVTSNRDAIGAKIYIQDEQGRKHYDVVTSGTGFASQNSSMMHFGLGASLNTFQIIIEWPSGISQTINTSLAADKFYKIVEGEEPTVLYANSAVSNTLQAIEIELGPNPAHDILNLNSQKVFEEEVNISVFNRDGKLVLTNNWDSGLLKRLDISLLSSGIYTLRLAVNDSFYSANFIKN